MTIPKNLKVYNFLDPIRSEKYQFLANQLTSQKPKETGAPPPKKKKGDGCQI